MDNGMNIFGWLVQASYDLGQAAVAARKYDGQAAARLRQVSEICSWNADHFRPFLDWEETGVIEFPECPIKSSALSTDEAEIGEDGMLSGSLVNSLTGLLKSRPKALCKIAPGTTGVSDLKSLLEDIENMLEMSFEALLTSAMNCMGRKLAIQTGKSYQNLPIVDNYDATKPVLYFCTICGRNYIETLKEDKCELCGSGWNAMEVWPKEK